MTRFERERTGFATFKSCFLARPNLQTEVARAVEALYARYDTAIRENRFVVGGALEIILGAALRACGLPVRHRGTETVEWDLLWAEGPGGYSIKSLLKPGTRSTRLVNVLGREVTPEMWQAATLFVLPEGIVYADPDLPWWRAHRHDPQVLVPRRDALEVKRRAIREFAAAEPDWFLPWQISLADSSTDARRRVRTASYDVATSILKDESPGLFRHLPNLI
ncbi:MAG: hypothetical protein GXO37_08240 [Chloroflexi bacterium]|nr:hypothetical protein [Chloroflexota bacterium]